MDQFLIFWSQSNSKQLPHFINHIQHRNSSNSSKLLDIEVNFCVVVGKHWPQHLLQALTSIHFLLPAFFPFLGQMNLCSITWSYCTRGRGKLDRSQSQRTLRDKQSNQVFMLSLTHRYKLQLPVNLTCMALVCGKKLLYLEKIHVCTNRAYKTPP